MERQEAAVLHTHQMHSCLFLVSGSCLRALRRRSQPSGAVVGPWLQGAMCHFDHSRTISPAPLSPLTLLPPEHLLGEAAELNATAHISVLIGLQGPLSAPLQRRAS